MSFEEFARELQRLTEEGLRNTEVGINEIAEDLLSTSQKLAPLDDGGLMENGTVEKATKTGSEITAKVGYNKVYALKMHENFYSLGATSSRKPSFDGMRVGRKFLEQPVIQNGDKYADHLAKRVGGGFND